MHLWWYSPLLIVLVTLECLRAQQIEVRVVKQTPGQQLDIKSLDFTPISNRLTEQRSNLSHIVAANFTGPELLRPLLNQCFLHEDTKYVFRVCPFSNVTQHEKSTYAFNFLTTSFHAVLGIWREWQITNTFDSLLYLHGDTCEPGVTRKVRVHLQCSDDWTITDLAYVKNVTELEKCFYLIELTSSLFCEVGSVYSRLDSDGKMEWDVLETYYQSGDITPQGYDQYLKMILNNYGLGSDEWQEEWKKSKEPIEKKSQSEIDLCMKKIKQLEKENMQLKLKLQLKENN